PMAGAGGGRVCSPGGGGTFPGPAGFPGSRSGGGSMGARPQHREFRTWVAWREARMRSPWIAIVGGLVGVIGSVAVSHAETDPDWTRPFPPFEIAGNLYYVGSKGLASYLIATPQGHILINSDLEENVPLIRSSVEQLGFKLTDIRVLLISHAHWDHAAASSTIKGLTGAKYMVMDADVPVVESGGKADFQYGSDPASLYAPAKVDRVL